MTEYEKNISIEVAFSTKIVNQTVGEVISEMGFQQLRIAESEKERFVTIYFNGLHEDKFKLEDRVIVPSPGVATYDNKPKKSTF